MRLASLLAALLVPASVALTGCVEESSSAEDDEDDALGETSAAIVGGTVDDGHRAVVALTFQGQAFCSGTLVSPTVVVTAAHCLHQDFVERRVIDGVRVFFGTSVAGAGTTLDVTEILLHPDFRSDDPEQDDDVAMLRLAAPAPETPLAMGRAPEEGASLTLIGFGRPASDVAETGVKRASRATVDMLTPRLMVLRPGANGSYDGLCNGDSGGAAIAVVDGVETLVGVHTRSDCASGMIEERVDALFDGFIEPFIGESVCIGCDEAEDEREPREEDVEATEDEAEADEADDDADATAEPGAGLACTLQPGATRGSGLAHAAFIATVALAARRRSRAQGASRTVVACSARAGSD